MKKIFTLCSIYILVVFVFHFFYKQCYFDVEILQHLYTQNRIICMLIFVILMSTGMVTLLPISMPFLLFSGFFWGPVIGTIITTIATTISAATSFYIARHFSDLYIFRRVKSKINSTLYSLENKKIAKYIVLAIINPFIPQPVTNYGAGLTKISFGIFIFANISATFIMNYFYNYIGFSIKNFALDIDSKKTIYMLGGFLSVVMVLFLIHDFFIGRTKLKGGNNNE